MARHLCALPPVNRQGQQQALHIRALSPAAACVCRCMELSLKGPTRSNSMHNDG